MAENRIEVFQYLGYNGGFARERRLLWKAEIVNFKGERRNCDKNSWHGYPEKTHPLKEAEWWSGFLGWPIVDLGRVEGRDDSPKG